MLHRAMLKVVLGGLLAISAAAMTGCQEPTAEPGELVGQDVHERHATGIDSQVADN